MATAGIFDTSNIVDGESPEDRVFRVYSGIVSKLSFARTSAVEYTDECACIWTVIDVAPEDWAARQQVYDAELAASDAAPDAVVTFRLINQREFSPEMLRQMLPAGVNVDEYKAATS